MTPDDLPEHLAAWVAFGRRLGWVCVGSGPGFGVFEVPPTQEQFRVTDRAAAGISAALDAALAREAALREAARDLMTAVTYNAPPRAFGTLVDPNPCWEARIPVGFTEAMEDALSSPAAAAEARDAALKEGE